MRKRFRSAAVTVIAISAGAIMATTPANACESSPGVLSSICGLDIESMVMAVQGTRASGLDEQLKSQIEYLGNAKSRYESASAKFMALPVASRTSDLVRALDVLDSDYQMARLRLTSLMNKKEEAFDVMTNFIKKYNEQRHAIVGNMR